MHPRKPPNQTQARRKAELGLSPSPHLQRRMGFIRGLIRRAGVSEGAGGARPASCPLRMLARARGRTVLARASRRATIPGGPLRTFPSTSGLQMQLVGLDANATRGRPVTSHLTRRESAIRIPPLRCCRSASTTASMRIIRQSHPLGRCRRWPRCPARPQAMNESRTDEPSVPWLCDRSVRTMASRRAAARHLPRRSR